MTLHLNGMRHEGHNDSCNGTYAYIFSLTPDLSTFTGGQTIIIGTVDEIETTSTMETGTTIGIGTMGGILCLWQPVMCRSGLLSK